MYRRWTGYVLQHRCVTTFTPSLLAFHSCINLKNLMLAACLLKKLSKLNRIVRISGLWHSVYVHSSKVHLLYGTASSVLSTGTRRFAKRNIFWSSPEQGKSQKSIILCSYIILNMTQPCGKWSKVFHNIFSSDLERTTHDQSMWWVDFSGDGMTHFCQNIVSVL